MDKRFASELEHIMEGRSTYRYDGSSSISVSDSADNLCVSVAAPVISEGDVMGCVMFVSPRNSAPCTDIEYKLAQTVASFLGKQMES